MTTQVKKETFSIDGVTFEATLWHDLLDNTVDVEATALMQSQYLYYPGSSLVSVEANVYTVPAQEWQEHILPIAIAAMAAA
jgi:hypothetical protein